MTRGVLFGVLTAAVGLSGCTTGGEAFRVPLSGEPTARVSAVDIRNANGSVTLTVDRSATEPKVYARPDGEPTALGAEAPGKDWVSARLEPQPEGPVLIVVAEHPDGADSGHRVDLTVTVPGCRSTTIRNAGGAVRVTGVGGSIDIQAGDAQSPGGDVLVRTAQPLRDAVTLETSSGRVQLSIGPDSVGNFTLETDSGEATFNGRRVRLSGVRAHDGWWRGVLNGGSNPVVLRSGEGPVHVSVVSNPESVSFASWFGG